ncbi:hypothetical protein HDU67_003566 [Dinochytrium kinnereticum]|nr:hypothetical protein HDU67_003566 [Dinochytrium kinnereticum]
MPQKRSAASTKTKTTTATTLAKPARRSTRLKTGSPSPQPEQAKEVPQAATKRGRPPSAKGKAKAEPKSRKRKVQELGKEKEGENDLLTPPQGAESLPSSPPPPPAKRRRKSSKADQGKKVAQEMEEPDNLTLRPQGESSLEEEGGKNVEGERQKHKGTDEESVGNEKGQKQDIITSASDPSDADPMSLLTLQTIEEYLDMKTEGGVRGVAEEKETGAMTEEEGGEAEEQQAEVG